MNTPSYDELLDENKKLQAQIDELNRNRIVVGSNTDNYKNLEAVADDVNDQILSETHFPVLLVDKNTRTIIMANEPAIAFYGYSREQLLNAGIDLIIPTLPNKADLEDTIAKITAHCLADGTNVRVQVRSGVINISNKDFVYITVKHGNKTEPDKTSYSFQDFSHNNQLKYIVELNKELIVANTKINIANEALRTGEAYLQSIIRATPVGIGVVRSQKIGFVNKQLCEITGYSHDELVGRSFSSLFVNSADFDLFMRNDNAQQLLKQETNWTKKDGTIIDVSLNVARLDEGLTQDELNITLAAKDITDEKKVQKDLITAKERAEQSDRLKSAFLANISHEIRTPMNGILGFTELLNQDSLPPSKRKYYIDLIYESSNQLLSILTNIIDISKLQAGQMEFKQNMVNLNAMFADLSQLYRYRLSKQAKSHIKLRLNLKAETENLEVKTDEELLRQVFNHLTDNAIKFTHSGEIEFGYTYSDGNHIQFYVKDTGIGIPQSVQQNVFEKFVQADNESTRQYGGVGLGLTLSKGLVELLGGKLWFVSEENHGTTVYFSLETPITTLQPSFAPKAEQPQLAEYNWQRKNILIVEDDLLNYFYLNEVLEPTNVILTHAANGQEAVDFCKNIDYDLILMDIHLPVKSGIEAVREIREFNPVVPIVAQTANVVTQDKQSCLQAGCNAYLPKPIDLNDLLQLLNQFLSEA